MMMQVPTNSFLGHPGLQTNYQSMMIGAESHRLLPSWNYPPPPPPPPPPTHPAGSAGSTSVFNCLPVDRPSSNDDKSIQGQTQHHQQLASSSSPSSLPFAGGARSCYSRFVCDPRRLCRCTGWRKKTGPAYLIANMKIP